jgi:hypothetical protein
MVRNRASNSLRERDGAVERSATSLDSTTTYAEVREQTPPLTRKDNQTYLPHLWDDPPDKIESPAGSASHGAPENDRLGGTIEKLNTDATKVPQGDYSQPENLPQPGSENSQQKRCERCSRPFTPRKGSGGKPQRYCSPECRKGTIPNAPRSEVPNVQPTPKAAEDVRNGVGNDEDDSDEFRWNDEDIVVPCQPPIAIYRNPSGGIVIRQDQTAFYDNDHWIVVLPENLPRLIRRLQEIERTGE